jgi:CheY-like chemotaxis protein
VEDDALIAEDLRGIVTALGCAVVALTDSGEEAVRLGLELRPDLVLMDFRLRGPMNGVEAANLLQQSVAAAVVYVSANSEVLKQRHVVGKPFSRATLHSVMTAALLTRSG